jgi:hypothetical protein
MPYFSTAIGHCQAFCKKMHSFLKKYALLKLVSMDIVDNISKSFRFLIDFFKFMRYNDCTLQEAAG